MKSGFALLLALFLVLGSATVVAILRSRSSMELPNGASATEAPGRRRCFAVSAQATAHGAAFDRLVMLDTVRLSGPGLDGWWKAWFTAGVRGTETFPASWRWAGPDSMDVKLPSWPVGVTIRFERSGTSSRGRAVWRDDAGGESVGESTVIPAQCAPADFPPSNQGVAAGGVRGSI
jgi:hypothetical protein